MFPALLNYLHSNHHASGAQSFISSLEHVWPVKTQAVSHQELTDAHRSKQSLNSAYHCAITLYPLSGFWLFLLLEPRLIYLTFIIFYLGF